MKHPEVFLVPILMLADYLMTLIGAVLSKRKYGQHVRTEHYELNPVWQTAVARRKWFNPKHLFLVAVLTSLLFLVGESGAFREPFVEAVLGAVLIIFGTLLGRHLSNLIMFWHVIRTPEQISGQLTMSHALVLSISMYQYLVVCVPFVIVATFMPSPFTFGGLFGIALLLVAHMGWITRNRRRAKDAAKPVAGDGAS